jgi:hypothetical protein
MSDVSQKRSAFQAMVFNAGNFFASPRIFACKRDMKELGKKPCTENARRADLNHALLSCAGVVRHALCYLSGERALPEQRFNLELSIAEVAPTEISPALTFGDFVHDDFRRCAGRRLRLFERTGSFLAA